MNQLAEAACRAVPPLAELRRRVSDAAVVPVCVTGSGSGRFALCDDASEGAEVLARLPADLPAQRLAVSPNPW